MGHMVSSIKVLHGKQHDPDIPEDLIEQILCRSQLHTVFQLQTISTKWRDIVSSSEFGRQWDELHPQKWFVMSHNDGVFLFDAAQEGRWLNKIFSQWIGNTYPQWVLQAAGEGLLLLNNMETGRIQVMNPLTMEFHNLPDLLINPGEYRLSRELRYMPDVPMHLKYDFITKTYEVTVFNYMIQDRLQVCVYRSSQRSWETKGIEGIAEGEIQICKPSYRLSVTCKGVFYWFSSDGQSMFSYDLTSQSRLKTTQRGSIEWPYSVCGVVVYKKDRIMMVTSTERWTSCEGRNIRIYEMDEGAPKWNPVAFQYKTIVNCECNLLVFSNEDYIWIACSCKEEMMSIDVDSGQHKVWPNFPRRNGFMATVLSTPLRFSSAP